MESDINNLSRQFILLLIWVIASCGSPVDTESVGSDLNPSTATNTTKVVTSYSSEELKDTWYFIGYETYLFDRFDSSSTLLFGDYKFVIDGATVTSSSSSCPEGAVFPIETISDGNFTISNTGLADNCDPFLNAYSTFNFFIKDGILNLEIFPEVTYVSDGDTSGYINAGLKIIFRASRNPADVVPDAENERIKCSYIGDIKSVCTKITPVETITCTTYLANGIEECVNGPANTTVDNNTEYIGGVTNNCGTDSSCTGDGIGSDSQGSQNETCFTANGIKTCTTTTSTETIVCTTDIKTGFGNCTNTATASSGWSYTIIEFAADILGEWRYGGDFFRIVPTGIEVYEASTDGRRDGWYVLVSEDTGNSKVYRVDEGKEGLHPAFYFYASLEADGLYLGFGTTPEEALFTRRGPFLM